MLGGDLLRRREVDRAQQLAGATGWIAWCNSDYDQLIGQDPYRQHPFELHFGLTDSGGAPKPQLAEMGRFAELLRSVDIGQCERADTDAALIVPSYLDTAYPFTSRRDRVYASEALRQCDVAARLADLPVALTRESDGVSRGARLYLLPSAKQLLGPTWPELEAIAAAGATVYVSYSAGDSEHHPGPWYPQLNALFGVQHQLRNGLVDPIEDEQVTFTFAANFGTLPAGARLSFSVAGSEYGRAFLPVRPDGADVIAVDGHDRPALPLRRVGAGAMVLCTYPIEHLAAMTARVNPEATSTLYDALAAFAGVSRPVTVDNPRIAADIVVRADGARFLWLVSQAAEPVVAKPQLAAGLRLAGLDGSAVEGTVGLDPFGVSVFALMHADDSGPVLRD